MLIYATPNSYSVRPVRINSLLVIGDDTIWIRTISTQTHKSIVCIVFAIYIGKRIFG